MNKVIQDDLELAQFFTSNYTYLKNHVNFLSSKYVLKSLDVETAITVAGEILLSIYLLEVKLPVEQQENLLTLVQTSDKLRTLVYSLFVKEIHPPH